MGAAWLATAAPAAAQAKQAEPRPANFLLFFDWGKQEPIGGSDKTLDDAAAAFRGRPGSKILLIGHTDRSGSASHNLRAGERRAAAIRAQLIRRDIPAAQISTSSDGEARPLVPTEDGVREIQNRRVEVRIVMNDGQ
jgi:outer membrane protein OmpA-like peptidoglycan-associated protein